MNRCATCRWWQPAKGQRTAAEIVADHPPPDYEARGPGYEVRFCGSPLLVFHEMGCSLPPSYGAVVADGSEYFAVLITGPDFGCVNHEARE